MNSPPQILVTNDDGIDAVGLHVLARALRPLGEVTIVAPEDDFSGSGSAIGPIWEHSPDVHKARVEGIDNAWSVSGPPALCVLYAYHGTFGFKPDVVVSGVNPGANVGRAIYYSGTVGAAISARIGGLSAVAISQAVRFGVEGQAWGEVVANMKFETAAAIAVAATKAILEDPPVVPSVLNINVPDVELDQIEGWQWCDIATLPNRGVENVTLTPKPGHTDSYDVELSYSDPYPQQPGTDTGVVNDNQVALTWLSPITAMPVESPTVETNIKALLQQSS